MSGDEWAYFDHECIEYYGDSPTKEQAAIREVMEEKYKKVWNGKEWVSTDVNKEAP